MDYDACITKIDGALMSLKKRGYLNHPDFVTDVVDTIKEIVQNFTEKEKNKAVYFMILNTDLKISDRLQEDENVGLFIRTPVYLEKIFLIDYLYESGLQDYLNCVIKFCPSAITLELLECLIKQFNKGLYKDIKYGHQHIFNLWEAVFVKIWRVENEYDTDDTKELIFYFKELYYILKNVLLTSQDNSKQSFGFYLYYYFNSIKYFVDLFTKKVQTPLKDDVFNLIISRSGSDSVQNSCRECFEIIFNNLKDVLHSLTIDTWMDLLEVDIKSKSAQELIGNCIHNIYEDSNVLNIPGDVLTFLSCLKIKPKTEFDEIAEADLGTIIQKVNEGKKEWFEGLIKHDDFCKEESLECMLKNLNLASEDDINVILSTLLINFKKIGTLGQKVFFAAFKQLPEIEYKIWTDKIFDECHPISLLNQNDLIETFNKFTKEGNMNTADLLCLFVQAPHDIIKRICAIAVDNTTQIDFCIKLLKTLLENAVRFFTSEKENSLSLIIKKTISSDLNDRQRQSVIEFVTKLTREKLLENNFIFLLFQVIKKSLLNDEIDKAVLCLRIGKQILEEDLVAYNKPVVLVLFSQMLGHLSWDLETFSTVKADGVDIVVQIVAVIIRKLNENVELEWARHEVLKSWEVTQAVFCDLWFQFGKKWVGSRKFHSCILALAYSNHPEFVLEMMLSSEDALDLRSSIILSLYKVLPVISYQSWLQIFDRLVSEKTGMKEPQDVLDLFGSALYLLTLRLQVNSEIYCCYKYFLRNYGRLVNQTMPNLKTEGLFRTIERLALVLYTIKRVNEVEDCTLILSPVIIDLMKQLEKASGCLEFQGKAKEVFRVIEEKSRDSTLKLFEKLKC